MTKPNPKDKLIADMLKVFSTDDIPKEIIEAAVKLKNYFDERNIKTWQLYGVCSRDHAYYVESIKEKLQQEYDKHYEHYRKGCRGCIVAMWAVRDVAKKLGIPIKEKL